MQTSNRRVILAYLLWVLLALMVGYVAWVLHATIVALLTNLVNSPGSRPFGWTSESVQPFSRLATFMIGSAALIYGLWLENRLQRSAKENNLWRYALYTFIALAIIRVVCLFLLSL